MMRLSLIRSILRPRPVFRVQIDPNRKGIGLIEVIVAMVILAITLTSLAPLMYNVSRSTIAVTGNAYRNGVLMQEVNRLTSLPYDDLLTGTTTVTVSTAPYPHKRTTVITEPVTNLKLVKVKVAPLNTGFKPDSVSFNRTKARTSKYLCTTCQ
jgi:prepilin-type N-terminal cleavage/methylation domain-containing protein